MTTEAMDAKVQKLMGTVKARRAKVGKLKKPQWLTSCRLVLPGHEALNIQVCQDLGLLAMECGALLRMKQDIEAAAKELDVEIVLQWQNYEIDDWIKDIKLRVQVTQIKAEKAKLASLEAKLNKLLSPDQRREIELASIADELGD